MHFCATKKHSGVSVQKKEYRFLAESAFSRVTHHIPLCSVSIDHITIFNEISAPPSPPWCYCVVYTHSAASSSNDILTVVKGIQYKRRIGWILSSINIFFFFVVYTFWVKLNVISVHRVAHLQSGMDDVYRQRRQNDGLWSI